MASRKPVIEIVTPSSVLKPAALAPGKVPKRLLRRGLAIAPRRLPDRAALRILFEHALPRYVVALLPFPVAAILWPELALPISQAPLLMLILVLFIESNVLSIGSPAKRRALVTEAEAARGLDLLNTRARDLLTRIAAHRGLARGTLHLVVEQSAMARVRPFTLVSVQSEETGEVLDLDETEQALLRDRLFDGELTEGRLHMINVATDTPLRAIAFDARAVSAHARLAALAAQAAPEARVAPG